jgi:hypothetical protein
MRDAKNTHPEAREVIVNGRLLWLPAHLPIMRGQLAVLRQEGTAH